MKLPRMEFGTLDMERTLERLSGEVAPPVAAAAERMDRRGLRWGVAAVVALCVVEWVLTTGWALGIPGFVRNAHGVLLLAVPAIAVCLGVFGRVAWAGRALVPCLLLPLLLQPPAGNAEAYFGAFAEMTALQLGEAFLIGWALDFGTGGFFAPGIAEMLVRVPFVFGIPACLHAYGERFAGLETNVWLQAGLLGAVVVAGLAWRFSGKAAGDVSRLARYASVRTGRRLCGRAVAILFLLAPAFLTLAAMEGWSRFRWPDEGQRPVTMRIEAGRRQVLELWEMPFRGDGGAEGEFALYIPALGRVATEKDLANGDFYDVPIPVLVDPGAAPADWPAGSPHRRMHDRVMAHVGMQQAKTDAEAIWVAAICRNAPGLGEMEMRLPPELRARGRRIVLWLDRNIRLGSYAVQVCDAMAAIEAAPADSAAAMSRLRKLLEPYRITERTAHEVGARMRNGFHSVLIRCSERTGRPYFSLSDGQSAAGRRTLREADFFEMRPWDRETLRRQGARSAALAIPGLVAVLLAGLLLCGRGGSSPVALCLGVAVAAAQVQILVLDRALAADFQHSLWELACGGPLGSLLAGVAGLSTLMSGHLAECFGGLAMTMAFVLLCLPCGGGGRRSRGWRLLRFAGLVAVVGTVSAAVQWMIIKVLLTSDRSADLFWIEALLRVGLFGAVGCWLRRSRRELTEAPLLGWRFPAVWLCLLLPPRLMASAAAAGTGGRLLEPVWAGAAWFTPAFALGATLAVAGWCLFAGMCVRTGFLGVLDSNRLTLGVFSLLLPVGSEVANGFLGDLLEDSGLFSGLGNRTMGILLTVTVMTWLWKRAENLLRRLFVRGLGRVEVQVERTLEAAFDGEGESVRSRLDGVLHDAGVEEWAFYRRVSDGGFRLAAGTGWRPRTGAFSASGHLVGALGGAKHVVERPALAMDVGLFFESFELRRLMDALGAESVLPISLGTSLRGVLATPRPPGEFYSQDDVAAEVNDAGVELANEGGNGGLWR